MIICVGGEKGELVMCIDGRWRGDVCKWVLRGDVEWQYMCLGRVSGDVNLRVCVCMCMSIILGRKSN